MLGNKLKRLSEHGAVACSLDGTSRVWQIPLSCRLWFTFTLHRDMSDRRGTCQKEISCDVCVRFPHLQTFQVRPLHADHRGQQLVLQTVSGDCEIDQSALGLQLGLVMRAGQLGVQDEAETGVVLALLISYLDVPVWVNEHQSFRSFTLTKWK